MNSGEFQALGDVTRLHARNRPDAVAIVYEGSAVTYRRLHELAEAICARLRAAGIAEQDRVALLGKNSVLYVASIFGTNYAGAVLVPLNWRLSNPEIEYILQDSDSRLVIADPEFAPPIREISDKLDLRVMLVNDFDGISPEDLAPSGGVPPLGAGREDVAVQVYTSGTTGRPKGAMLKNGNFLKMCDLDRAPTPAWFRMTAEDVNLMAMPQFHVGGMEASLRSIFAGGKLVLHREFEPAAVLEDIERHRVTTTSLVPTALQMVIQHPNAATTDFRSLETLYYGASPIPLDLLREALKIVNCQFVQCYGMTETNGTIVTLPPADHTPEGNQRMNSAGLPLPGVNLKVVDADGRRLEAGKIGEVAVSAGSVMKGYWNLADATAEAIDAEGWLYTGDAGYLDEAGYVYICDRVKDMIVSGAENVYPAEVESAIYGHPAVHEVAVIGVPDDKWGEAVKAVVVPNPGHVIDEAELIAWTKSRIASYKAPRSVDVVAELPRNASGKVLKTELRERYWAGRGRSVN